jgi:hypothetical protein
VGVVLSAVPLVTACRAVFYIAVTWPFFVPIRRSSPVFFWVGVIVVREVAFNMVHPLNMGFLNRNISGF